MAQKTVILFREHIVYFNIKTTKYKKIVPTFEEDYIPLSIALDSR